MRNHLFQPKRSIYNKFVSVLPEFIQKILLETGFDTEISLEELEEENVKFIEDFVKENRYLLAGTIYEKKNTNEFKFLIGHRALLLALPRKIKEANSKKETTNKKIKRGVENYSELKEEEIAKLKEDLIEKLKKYSASKNLCLEIDSKDICEFMVQEDRVKCRVQCPYCSMKSACFKTKYWYTSNIESHLKKHLKEITATANQMPHSLMDPTNSVHFNAILNSK